MKELNLIMQPYHQGEIEIDLIFGNVTSLRQGG